MRILMQGIFTINARMNSEHIMFASRAVFGKIHHRRCLGNRCHHGLIKLACRLCCTDWVVGVTACLPDYWTAL